MLRDERLPSQEKEDYWIYALNETGNYTLKRGDSGKWLLFEDRTTIDAVWNIIKEGTRQGLFGNTAKVSTARPNKNASNQEQAVICIYSADFDDQEDVKRIEENIRSLGIEHKLVYKLDKDVGKYEHKGHKNLAQLMSYSEAYYHLCNALEKKSIQEITTKDSIEYQYTSTSKSVLIGTKKRYQQLGFQIIDVSESYFTFRK